MVYAGVILLSCALAVGNQPERSASTIELRSGAMTAPRAESVTLEAVLRQHHDRHLAVRLATGATSSERADLRNDGLALLTYLGDNMWFAALSSDADVTRVAVPLIDAQPIDARWKLHPRLLDGHWPSWALVEPVGHAAPSIVLNVLFHDDVPAATATAPIRRHGGTIRTTLTSLNGAVIELPIARIGQLAAEDDILWIEPPLPALGTTNDGARLLTGAQALQRGAEGLRGSGVVAMVYDVGVVDDTHPDFTGRLTIGPADTNFISLHSTHVAGTVGGDGRAQCGQFQGMAPEAEILSYGFRSDSSGLGLYTNIGDIEKDYGEGQALGAAVANNSIGTNICVNGQNDPVMWSCLFTGDYGVTSAAIDAIARGAVGHALPIVWAAGNERGCERCVGLGGADEDGFASTAPPSCAKNPIVVGAVYSDTATMTAFSSWGPCDDGRLRPDVVAPGCQTTGDFGTTSTSFFGGYISACGTSMAAPVVTGLGAIVVEEHRRLYPRHPDPDGATFKALVIHNATDLGEPGPDYQNGYGLVDFEATIAFLRNGDFTRGSVEHGQFDTHHVEVEEGDPVLTVTVAWDDVPGTPNAAAALVNDLDVVAIAPGGTQHYPWTLSPTEPGAPAVQTGSDHRNNVEQVHVTDPERGVWRIEVRGHDVPEGTQSFALCASPRLLACSQAGTVRLDSSALGCEGTSLIEIVDCGLDEQDDASDTTSAHVWSDSTPAGVTVTLTEVDQATATFRGHVAFDLGGGGGQEFIAVSPGDTVHVEYVDADDGHGGQDVAVGATAVIDCVAPEILRAEVVRVAEARATVEVVVNEPAQVIVLHGPGCKNLTFSTTSAPPSTFHSIELAGVDAGSAFVVVARDIAGNTIDTPCALLAEPDCNTNGIGDFSEIGDNLVADCNTNRIPDPCDVVRGAADCQPDGVPDSCQVDCNRNGTPDDCDITTGFSMDCDANTIPDECDVLAVGPDHTIVFDPPLMIEPGGAVFDTLEIDHLGVIGPMEVRLDIRHSHVPSLRIRLSNGQDVVTLFDACINPGQDLRHTVFRDDALMSICDAAPPYEGAFRPIQPLSTFAGGLAHGDWSLVVSALDDAGCGFLDSWSLVMPMDPPDCNINASPDSCDIADGSSSDDNDNMIPDDCEDGCPRVAGSTPAHDAIDARQPHDPADPRTPYGWTALDIAVINVSGEVMVDDFSVSEQGGDGLAPTITAAVLDEGRVTVTFDAPLEPGTWTIVTHLCSGVDIRLGYLPGDVNGDALAGALDVLTLIDALNGIADLPPHATDIDRSMATEPLDILRLIDLLNGAGPFEAWNGRELPE